MRRVTQTLFLSIRIGIEDQKLYLSKGISKRVMQLYFVVVCPSVSPAYSEF